MEAKPCSLKMSRQGIRNVTDTHHRLQGYHARVPGIALPWTRFPSQQAAVAQDRLPGGFPLSLDGSCRHSSDDTCLLLVGDHGGCHLAQVVWECRISHSQTFLNYGTILPPWCAVRCESDATTVDELPVFPC